MKIVVSNEKEQEAAYMIINGIVEILDSLRVSKYELIYPENVEEFIILTELNSIKVGIDEDETPLIEKYKDLKKEWDEHNA